MRDLVFPDRRAAGALLGKEVATHHFERAVVLGLPRGGVPVAAEVAAAIHAPLDVIVVRKLGVPRQPELAMGAIGEDGIVVVNHDVLRSTRVDEQQFAEIERLERLQLERALGTIRLARPRHDLADRCAIIVDDGIATGATVRAAIDVARAHGAARIVVATPVAPGDVVAALGPIADSVLCLESPHPFGSVGRWYREFAAVTDVEVAELLTSATHRDGC
jgi:putative phosphoribosyl transferase